MGWAFKLKVNPGQVRIKRLPGKWGSYAPDGLVTPAGDLTAEAEGF
ncbi:hypothetical protein KGD83_16045 [Nocardiopsis akebiae]|uniref:Uncharacterized protein n=1 Tax=Nocardiopsis akebiae TaxID=2831968 RepID=A0ABX8BXG9_9ACTN|nr:hypothetical protein [Nocardiopsis akebiae]QUX26882.1 hypothetical protein KGD83_16045 [Nocardiopsis akebiae]